MDATLKMPRINLSQTSWDPELNLCEGLHHSNIRSLRSARPRLSETPNSGRWLPINFPEEIPSPVSQCLILSCTSLFLLLYGIHLSDKKHSQPFLRQDFLWGAASLITTCRHRFDLLHLSSISLWTCSWTVRVRSRHSCPLLSFPSLTSSFSPTHPHKHPFLFKFPVSLSPSHTHKNI